MFCTAHLCCEIWSPSAKNSNQNRLPVNLFYVIIVKQPSHKKVFTMNTKETCFADDVINAGWELNPDTHVFNIQCVYDMLTFERGGIEAFLPEDAITTEPTNPLFDFCFVEWKRDVKRELELEDDTRPTFAKYRKMAHENNLEFIDVGFYMSRLSRLPEDAQERAKKVLPQGILNGNVYVCEGFIKGIGAILPFQHGYVLSWDRQTGVLNNQACAIQQVRSFGYIETNHAVMYGLPLTGFALMHIKNPLEFVEFPRQYARRVARETGKKPSPYFTLINPTATKKIYQGGTGKGGKQSPHVVRGHLRHNREHEIAHFAHRTFWIDAFVKGGGGNESARRNFKIVLPESEGV